MNGLEFPTSVLVTEQEVDCTLLSPAKREFIERFVRDLAERYEREGGRRIFGIAGPSGSGKSFLSVLAQTLMPQVSPEVRVVPVSIDAYHYPNEYLASKPSERGTLKEVKGRYDTYDVSALAYDLSEYKRGGTSVRFPLYSRKLHEPVPGAVKVEDGPTLLLIEGLWLLYEKGGWGELRPLFDRIVYLDDDPGMLRERTIARHMKGGRAAEDATAHYDESDAANRVQVEATRARADEVLVWPKEG